MLRQAMKPLLCTALKARSGNLFSVKGQRVNTFRTVGQIVSLNYSILLSRMEEAIGNTEAHEHYLVLIKHFYGHWNLNFIHFLHILENIHPLIFSPII